MSKYRQVGARLAGYIHGVGPTSQQLQAFLGDVLAGDELLLPMRDLVARQCFSALCPFAATGSGRLQRDVCLQELARSYLPKVVEEVGEVVNGLLEKPDDFLLHSVGTSASVIGRDHVADPWGHPCESSSVDGRELEVDASSVPGKAKRLRASEICDENLWNQQRDPEKDKAFLEAWNLRWFNKRYRPRLEQD